MAKQKQAAVPFEALKGLLGKTVDDAGVTAVLAGAGKVRVTSDFVVAKEAGFDFALNRPEGAKRNAKKVLSTLFLFPEGGDGHSAYGDLPPGFAFATRDTLLAALPTPARSWQIGVGEVPVTTEEVSADHWTIDGLGYRASYRDREVRHITVSLPDDKMGGARLATLPLHFSTRPADALPDAELTAMALLVAWAADRFGLSPKHAGSPLGEQLIAHAITPRVFLIGACAKTLTTLDFAPQLAPFLAIYTGNERHEPGEARATAHAKIKTLLHLQGDEHNYDGDFLGTFAQVIDNPFHIPDSWESIARIAPVIDARLADFELTQFRTPPNMKVYERAAKARDEWKVEPARATLARGGRRNG